TSHKDQARGQAIMERNLSDMVNHGAQSVIFLCPVCEHGLSKQAVERGMKPVHIVDLAFGKEHLEDLVPEDPLQMFQFEQRRYSEHAVSVKTNICRGSKLATA
ncbi:MAG: hypothetical protein SV375_03245, partial [Thermodesulfobacteriota bacterium]|nr:hypothetical protein [Thermodesulfobacteriota bacterium]